MKTLLKCIFWAILSLGLLALGSLMTVERLLKPSRLTPLVQTVANRALNADVSVGRVEMHFHKCYPFLNLQVDSLTILSRDMRRLPAAAADTMPQWVDTLATVGQIKGGINLVKLLTGAIVLNDVEISRPQINIVVVNDKLNNFNIYTSTSESDTTATEIPDIRVKSFRILDPGPFRYADLASGTSLCAQLRTADIISQAPDSTMLPVYKIDLDTNIDSPLLSIFGSQGLPIDFNGIVDWKHVSPYELTLSDFSFAISKLLGRFDAAIDFTDEMTIKSLDFELNPLSVSEVLDMIPEKEAKELSIPPGIRTNAAIALKGHLDKPYVAGTDMLPHAHIDLEIPECYLLWRNVDLRRFELCTSIDLRGPDIDRATVDIAKLVLAGPATTLAISGKLADLASDPLFDGYAKGWINLAKFPPVITKLIGGVHAKGKVSIDSYIKARPSMLARNTFHKLQLKGTVDANDFYYVAPDTLTMVYAHALNLNFGTNQTVETKNGIADSLLTASVQLDTASILVSGIDIKANNLKLGIGALGKALSSDTTAIIPMGGKLQLGTLSIFSISDSSGVKIRDMRGTAVMTRYQGDTHLPLFGLNVHLGRVSAGNNHTRFMVSDGQLNARLNKLPDSELSKGRRQVKHIADSLHRQMPELPIDSVYTLALEIRRRNSKRHGPRVKEEMTRADNEIIDWGTSSGVQRLLLDWGIKGNLTAQRARLFTASFPLRNRVRNLNIEFNNDTILLENVEYKAGHSDFLISGNITNMKRAFASRRPSPLKINFDMVSDTIDVNELANAFFVGAANSKTRIDTDIEHADDDKDAHIEVKDSVGPFLIPVNIDAEFRVRANNALYSDIHLHGLSGTALAYDGALNLHNLKASSAVGAIDMSALYSAPKPTDMKFGFGLKLSDFNIRDFLNLVPAIDSIMPLMRDFGGIINANIAATADVDQEMNLLLPTLSAAIDISGDSLVVIDEKTFKTMAKWLMFKNKHQNMIPHMSAQLIVQDNMLQLYPFMFDFDRYRIGVQGHNDLEMNINYHIAVLKSPLPFKFGINITGNIDDYKIRLGKAHFNEKQAVQQVALVDTTRINLINQFENVFRRGVRNSQFAQVNIKEKPTAQTIDLSTDTISAADSIYLREQGLIPQLNR